MKSAFELALERSGGSLNELSPDKKEKIAELDSICKAKIAEAEISADQKIQKLDDPAKIEEIKEGLRHEIASLQDRYEREKDRVRNA